MTALVAMGGTVRLDPGNRVDWVPLLTLTALALLAELLPVRVNREGLRITLSLPFLTGIALTDGPLGVIAADVFITLAAAIGLAAVRREGVPWKWLSANLAIAAVSSAAAGLCMTGFLTASGYDAWLLATLVFVLVYSVANFVIVTRLNSVLTRRDFSHNVLAGLKPGAIGLAIYCLVALGVAVLVQDGLVLLAPALFIPVIALRAGLIMKARMYEHYYETVTALTLMMQRTNPYTGGHLERVAKLAEEVAQRLGIAPRRARLVREAAVLHDIGKIAIDEAILDKPAKLTEAEMEHVRRHPVLGAEILSQCEQFRALVPWIRCHHERPDGTGYPNRLQDVEIPLESKIIAVVDAYDAMVGEPGESRPYRKAMHRREALEELERCSGTQFDPNVVRAFKEVLLREAARA
ncbi:MAG TPA: HD-GYP domain-containing protein [Fimbriimonadaceae bacterium]|nr:HD-GYP domain-containing protein [Fimbriimonadaceae bacterium]